MPKTAKRLGTGAKVAIGVTGALCVVYVAGVAFFSSVFMPNTTLLGRNVSLRTVSNVAASLDGRTNAYVLTVEGDGLDLSIPGTEISLTFDGSAYTRSAIEETNPWAWPIEVFVAHDITSAHGASYDADRLKEVVESAVNTFNEKASDPVNATIGYDEGAKAFVVKAEQPGTKLDSNAVLSSVKAAVDEFKTSVTLGEADLVKATVTSEDKALQKAADEANEYLKANVKLALDGLDAGTIDAGKIIDWVTLDENLAATLDTNAIRSWGANELSHQLDTVGTARTYTRPDGKTVTVTGGSYGWNINSTELADQLVSAIENGQTTTLQVPTYQTAEQLPDANGKDWGDTYIDADLAEQHARMYQGGQLVWESDFVSGNSSMGYDTPTGVYFIDSYFNKTSPSSTLIGKTDPETKKPEYETPVSYWMPFVGNAIGFHDATWRSNFGGTIYQTNGSHGCVNLPADKAAELCNLINQGTVVVVHG